jgi:hypothetical protein
MGILKHAMILIFYFLGFLSEEIIPKIQSGMKFIKESGEVKDHYTFLCDTSSWAQVISQCSLFFSYHLLNHCNAQITDASLFYTWHYL